jgi:hypothetical protein
MEGLMNFGCCLAEEERSEIDFSGGMAMRAGSSSWSCVFAWLAPYYFWRNGSHQLSPRHLPACISRITFTFLTLSLDFGALSSKMKMVSECGQELVGFGCGIKIVRTVRYR